MTTRNFKIEIANILLQIGAVNFAPHAPKTFKSGIVSPVYVDNRIIPAHPHALHVVIDGFRTVLDDHALDFDLIAGIAAGGIPYSASLGYALHKPSVFVRQEAKGHGLQNRVEGGNVDGKRALLVEDLVTTGGSSLSGVTALRESHAIVEDCLAIISYGFVESQHAFDEAGVRLYTLTAFPAILEQAETQGRYTQSELTTIADWFNDPHGWAERHGFG